MVRTDQTQDVTADLNALKSDLAKVRSDLSDMASNWMGKGREHAASAADDIKERLQTTAETVEGWVKERPVTTVLIAAGIGLVLGKLSSRR